MKADVLVALILLISIPLINSFVQALTTKISSANFSSSAPNRAIDIWTAAASGNADVIRMHIENGVDLNRLDRYGKSPLHWAIEKRHVKIAEVLLENGADATLKDINGESPLSMAAMSGYKSLAKLLLQNGAEMEVAAAALLENQEFFEEYLAKEGSLHLQNSQMSLLHLVASRCDCPGITQLIINHGAEVNAQDDWNATPLTYAAAFGNKEVVTLLIDNGAEVNAQTKDLQTPLHHAATGGHLHVADCLIKHGANLNIKANGGTALCRAAAEGYRDIAELLIEYGADINAEETSGMTPLHLASKHGQLSVAELLLTKGANINARYGVFGWTPLFFAESMEMIDLLKSYGANERMYRWAAIIAG